MLEVLVSTLDLVVPSLLPLPGLSGQSTAAPMSSALLSHHGRSHMSSKATRTRQTPRVCVQERVEFVGGLCVTRELTVGRSRTVGAPLCCRGH